MDQEDKEAVTVESSREEDVREIERWWRSVSLGVSPSAMCVDEEDRGGLVAAAYRLVCDAYADARVVVVSDSTLRSERWLGHLVASGFPRERSFIAAAQPGMPRSDWIACVATSSVVGPWIEEPDGPMLVVLDGVPSYEVEESAGLADVYVLEFGEEDENCPHLSSRETGENRTPPGGLSRPMS